MIPIDPVLLDAFRYSHVKSSYLSVYEGTTLVAEVVGISEGTVTADREQRARRKLDCTIPLSQWEDVVGLNVISSRVQAWTGYDLGGQSILVPIGTFRVDELGRSHSGELRVTGTSLEAYVMDDQFIDELIILEGVNILTEIQNLILESLPDATFEITDYALTQASVVMPYDLPAQRDRWDAILSMASIIRCDVYVAPNGKFRIAERPSMVDLLPVWRINEGPDGVLVSMNTQVGRDKTYNAVLAMGQSSNDGIPPYSAVVYDDDPTSPTRWGGPFGRKVFIYQDDLLGSKELCEAKATELLGFYKAEDRYLDFSSIPNPALEPDDAVQVTMLDGTVENHLITSVSIPLGLGEWTAETLSNKDTGTLNPARRRQHVESA